MISQERVTLEEFIDTLKKSNYIVFRPEFEDVKLFINTMGNKYRIVKVKRGKVKTSVDGFKGSRLLDVNFLKYWFDEFKLKIE